VRVGGVAASEGRKGFNAEGEVEVGWNAFAEIVGSNALLFREIYPIILLEVCAGTRSGRPLDGSPNGWDPEPRNLFFI
jgi:hypothetical protein